MNDEDLEFYPWVEDNYSRKIRKWIIVAAVCGISGIAVFVWGLL